MLTIGGMNVSEDIIRNVIEDVVTDLASGANSNGLSQHKGRFRR